MIVFRVHIFLLVGLMLCASCRKEQFVTGDDAWIRFSVDTLYFDTLFSTVGSVTKYCKAYNPHKHSIRIRRVDLESGNSYFRLNIDGRKADNAKDIVLKPRDSIYIFVEAMIDSDALFVVAEGAIVFTIENKRQNIRLVAWSRDVHKLQGVTFFNDTFLTAEKPYLVYGKMKVAPGVRLDIDSGASLYFHKGAGLYVEGNLCVQGSINKPVLFAGDRPEEIYDDIPGQWDGIYLHNASVDNSMSYVVIRNAVSGIQIGQVDNLGLKPRLELHNCFIRDMSYAGIVAFNAQIIASNCLIANCGSYAIRMCGGGDYLFYHSTVANYYQYNSRFTPSVFFSNTQMVYGVEEKNNLSVKFFNSIIYGNTQNEIEVGNNNTEALFEYFFGHCLIRSSSMDISDKTKFTGIITSDPQFYDIKEYNFSLKNTSPAINKGNSDYAMLYPYDVRGHSRMADVAPDMGTIEYCK